MSLVTLIETTPYRYNAKVVSGLIRSNRNRYKTVRPQTRHIIYLMMNRLVQNAISYYFNVKRNKGYDMSYMEAEDIAVEMYEVCDMCIDAYDETKGEFFFQFHTAVTRKMRKLMGSKSSSEVSYGFINTGDSFTDEEGIENMLSDMDGEYTSEVFDLEEIGKVLSDRQKNFVNKFLTMKEKPTAKDFGTNQNGYISAISRVTKAIEDEKPLRSMDKQIFLGREFSDIEKRNLPKEGEETVIVCKFIEDSNCPSFVQYEVLHFKNDGEEWDYYHLAVFANSDDAIMFADVKVRKLIRGL